MKLNKKEPNRTLHATAATYEGKATVGIVLVERVAYPRRYTSKKDWEEDRIILSVQEVTDLYNNLEKILKPAQDAQKEPEELKKDGTR